MSAKDGGAAFPSPGVVLHTDAVDERQQGAYEGISVRDYFAAHAPISLADARDAFHEVEGNSATPTGADLLELLVKMRLAYADAMIAERNQ